MRVSGGIGARERGRRRARAGFSAEAAVGRSNDWYRNQAVALVRHIPSPTVRVKDRVTGRSEIRPLRKLGVDYEGVVRFNGGGVHGVFFEVKSTSEPSIRLGLFKGHQHLYLLERDEFGALSFWLVFFRRQPEWWLIRARAFDVILADTDRVTLSPHYLDCFCAAARAAGRNPGVGRVCSGEHLWPEVPWLEALERTLS